MAAYGPMSGQNVPADPAEQEPEMQAGIDQHVAAGVGASATGSGGAAASSPQPPPGMQLPQDQTMLGMMQMMQQMTQVMMSFQQSGQGAAASGSSPPAASSPVGPPIGSKIRRWQTSALTNGRSTVWTSSPTYRAIVRSVGPNSWRLSASAIRHSPRP